MRYILALSFFSSVLSITCQTDILFTDFQNGIPWNYLIVDNDGLMPDPSVSQYSAAWISVTDPENSQDTLASSTSFFSPAGTADRWLITPPLSLGGFGNFIEWQAKSQDASFPDDYLVLVSKTDTQISSFTDTIGYILQENADWTTRVVDLSEEGYNNQVVYVAFRLITTDGFKLYLDDIHCWKEDPAELKEFYSNNIISCYPNPASEVINIRSSSPIVSCQIYTLDGSLVSSSVGNTLSVRELTNGVYFLTVVSGSRKKTLRFIKN